MKSPRQLVADNYRLLSQRLGANLLNEMLRTQNMRSTLTLSRLGAIALAMCVYAIWLAMLLGGTWLMLATFPNFILLPLGLVLVLMGVAARPRVPPFPKSFATAQDYPALFALVGQVADALQARNVDAIVLDYDFNASFSQPGWRRRAVLSLGLPLWESLEPSERVALLAHELAHGVNGDPLRGAFIGTALYSTGKWFEILHVRHRDGILGSLVNLVMYLLSYVPLGLAYGLAHLLWRDSQRAEYRADYLAAQVAGKAAQLGLLKKLGGAKNFHDIVHSLALNTPDADLYQAVRQHVSAQANGAADGPLTPEEYALDATHPPTGYRIQFIQARGAAEPSLGVTETEWARLDQELEPAKKEVQQKLVERYLRTKYY